MPGFDGTGPKGGGPMTGRGSGYCATPTPDGRPASFLAPAVWRWGLLRRFSHLDRPRLGLGLGRRRGILGFRRWW